MLHRAFRPLLLLLFLHLVGSQHAFAQQADVDIALDTFGVGSSYRPGDVTAIRLKLTSNLPQATPVWAHIEVTNADGDISEIGRSLTLSTGLPTLLWLYAPLPPQTDASQPFLVRVFEERDGRRGAELASARIFPSDAQALAIEPAHSMLAVVGSARLGLDHYRATAPNGVNPATHELTQVIYGLSPQDFPDRWEGLASYSAIAWAGDRSLPADLTLDQASALREYIRRGNHFIIVIPSLGNAWNLGATQANPLGDLLPSALPRKDESIPLSLLVSTLTKSSDLTRFISKGDPQVDLHVFQDLRGSYNAIDNHYQPHLALPDGRVIAIQRSFGLGRITIIGIDLADGRLSGTPPQGDAFWNRILGRRVDTPTTSEFVNLKDENKLGITYFDSNVAVASGNTFSKPISMTRQATIGLSLAIFLFMAYWIACVGGFFVLKSFKRAHLSWLAFAATAAVFTLFAWGAVAWQQQTSISIKHVTFLDHLARAPGDSRPEDPQLQRAIAYFSAYLPAYSNTRIRLLSDPGQRDLLFSWAPINEPIQYFPNPNRYPVDIGRAPNSLELPSRSTSTQLYANWMGGLPADWGGLLSVDPANPISVTVNPRESTELGLSGRIINNCPVRLTDVIIIWVKNVRPPAPRYTISAGKPTDHVNPVLSGSLIALGTAHTLKRPLEPGDAIDFSQPADFDFTTRSRLARFIDEQLSSPRTTGGAMGDDIDSRDAFRMLSFYSMLKPPLYFSEGNAPDASSHFLRYTARELDLSHWFTQPCLIIIASAADTPCPIPLRIGNADVQPSADPGSLTLIRWIYPLPIDPSIAFPPSPNNNDASAESAPTVFPSSAKPPVPGPLRPPSSRRPPG